MMSETELKILKESDAEHEKRIFNEISEKEQNLPGELPELSIAKELPDLSPGIRIIDAEWLVNQSLTPVKFIIDGLLPIGLSIIASPPKFGKSYFVLDMCLCVAQGKSFLGRKTSKVDCLYLALEDSENRLQTRILQLEEKRRVPKELKLITEIRSLSNGFKEDLDYTLRENPNIKLIVIDTLQFIRSGSCNRNEGAYAADYREMCQIKSYAKEKDICILLVHHSRKEVNPNDPFANISGTNGISGAMDTMLVMQKENRMDKKANLYITGRDIDQDALVVAFENFHWSVLGTVEDIEEQEAREAYDNDPIIKTIKAVIEESPENEWKGTASELLTHGKRLKNFIQENPKSLGIKLKYFDLTLLQNDNISYTAIKHGNAGKIHRFYKIPRMEDSPDDAVYQIEGFDLMK